MRLLRAALVAGVMVAGTLGMMSLAPGCAVNGFELGQGGSGGGVTMGSGGSGGTGAAGGGGNTGCQSNRWPDPPTRADPGDDVPEIVVAVRSIDFGETSIANGPTIGFNLDERCTCQGDGDSCLEPDFATADHCDGPGGTDNAVAQLFAAASVFDQNFSSAYQTERTETGDWSILLRIRNYNGQPNDDQIDVAMFPSPGVNDNPCTPNVAAWDGNDAFPIDAKGLGGMSDGTMDMCGAVGGYDLEQPVYHDPQGYVSDGLLVASLPEVALAITGGDDASELKLVAGFVSGQLRERGGDWFIDDGVIVGRWQLNEIFRTISTVASSDDPLCTNHPLYSALKNAICTYPDIASTLGGPTTPCDSLSFGMGFNAEPAQIGIIWEGAETMNNCPPEFDPAVDTCER